MSLQRKRQLYELGKIYIKGRGSGKVSKELAEFNYKELCFSLDNFYGLKEQHDIKDFQSLIKQIGFEDELLGTDPTTIDKRVIDILDQYLDDQHTYMLLSSHTSDKDTVQKYIIESNAGHSYDEYEELSGEFYTSRKNFFPDGVPAYQEIGDTAFITLDAFDVRPDGVDYYKTAPTADAKDTVGIIAYSVRQILRENSPIKNVVLDLSYNGGGTVYTALYTIAAFLGKCMFNTVDPNTGAQVTRDYMADTNFDGIFDSKDYLAGKGFNLYCLESGISFSCANTVPCIFKDIGKVTLLGQTSGGGSCSVAYVTTAMGSMLQISNASMMCFRKNCSFYDIDRGAVPDIVITKTETFYNRPAFVEFIDGLL